MGEPAGAVVVSCRAPEVPSSLQAKVGSVGSVMGLLQSGKSMEHEHRKILGATVSQLKERTS